jgi:hypothetical protein
LKSIPSVSSSATAATVNAAVDGVGFADADVKKVIGGSASVYSAFRTWAQSMTGGEAAVAISPHAAAAYLLGATRLFGYPPDIIIAPLNVAAGGGSGLTVSVTVMDGERIVGADSSKVGAMFEATSDLSDWNGASKITPSVTTESGDGNLMRFRVAPSGGTVKSMFLRIRKQL